MGRERILVVDDEEDILELIRYSLDREGYDVVTATSGEKALEATQTQLPDLIVLDLMLPGIDGLEFCRLLRRNEKTTHVPVVMVTAKGEEPDVVTGLELGADDYITKPFSPRVLLARIRAVLRRKGTEPPSEEDILRVHDLVVHPGRHEVLRSGTSLELTFSEFRILHYLARRPGWVFTRYQIIDAVHGDDYPVTDRSVDVQIASLRKKLGPAGTYIQTVRGVGYRFKE